MTTRAYSQLGMRSSTLPFCTVLCTAGACFGRICPHFTSPNRTKMSVANKSLKSRTKMSANKSFKSNSSRALWGKAAQKSDVP